MRMLELASSAKPLDRCAPSHYLRILPTFSIAYNTFQGSSKATPNFGIVGKGVENLEYIRKHRNSGRCFVNSSPKINSFGSCHPRFFDRLREAKKNYNGIYVQ